ncbi:hypothetical protein GC176_19825 [bacterium]|nr:hypothetical protein [bacterium]
MTNSNRPDFSASQSVPAAAPLQSGLLDPTTARSASDVLQDLDRLDQLLTRANRSLDQSEFESDRLSTEDRRRDERRNLLTEIVIVRLDSGNTDAGGGPIEFVRGQTLNLSVGGVAFVTEQPLIGDSHIALLRHPDFPVPRCCFELTLFRSQQLAGGRWEYGAVLRPLVPGPTGL